MNDYLKQIAVICGINKVLTSHVARHTFATTITLQNGVPIESVSKMLRHTNIRTTQIYAKILDTKDSEDMQALKGRLSKSQARKVSAASSLSRPLLFVRGDREGEGEKRKLTHRLK